MSPIAHTTLSIRRRTEALAATISVLLQSAPADRHRRHRHDLPWVRCEVPWHVKSRPAERLDSSNEPPCLACVDENAHLVFRIVSKCEVGAVVRQCSTCGTPPRAIHCSDERYRHDGDSRGQLATR